MLKMTLPSNPLLNLSWMQDLREGEKMMTMVVPHIDLTEIMSLRYLGSDPEPRPGLSSGHMPHSLSLPFNAFLDTTTFKPSPDAEEVSFTTLCTTQKIIENLREALGDDKLKEVMEGKRGVVTSCGSGMTAGVLWLGLKLLGVDRVALYDEVCHGLSL